MRSSSSLFALGLLLASALPAQAINLNTLPQGTSGVPVDAYPADLAEWGGRLYYSAVTAATGREFFSIDGSGAPPQLLADINPGSADSDPRDLVPLPNGRFVFSAEGAFGREPWVSDGTAAGTTMLADIVPNGSSYPRQLVRYQNHVYFLASNPSFGMDLWRTDGTTAGTVLIDSLGLVGGYSPANQSLVATTSGLYYLVSQSNQWPAGEWRLHKTDGTVGGSQLLVQVNQPDAEAAGEMVALGAGVVFVAATPGEGREIWVSDGTPAGTNVVDLLPGVHDAHPLELTELGGKVFFTAYESIGSYGGEIFCTDGTVAGTLQVTTSNGPYARPLWLTVVGNLLTYVTSDFTHGYELWSTTGAPGSETLYAEFAPGVTSGSPTEVVAFGGGVLCAASNGHQTTGQELFFSDGTPQGTYQVRDIQLGVASSSPTHLTVFAGKVYFAADDGLFGSELWVSDGTEAGTQMTFDLASSPTDQSSYPRGFASLGDRALFAADDGVHGAELWVTDGSAAGTVRITDYNGSDDSLPSGPWRATPFDGRAVFRFDDGVHGTELWISDGTPAGTQLLADLYPGQADSDPFVLREWRGEVYFVADTQPFASSLFATDGTAAGTRLVKGFTGILSGVDPRGAVEHDGRLYFAARTSNEGVELWSTDGTTAGTAIVVDLYPGTGSGLSQLHAASLGGHLYFAGADQTGDVEMWRTDGTAPGTSQVANVYAPSSSLPSDFHTIGNRVVFSARAGSDYQYFSTDGTNLQQLSFAPLYIHGWTLYSNGQQLIGVLRGANGSMELWGTDGTPAGSGVIQQIWPDHTEYVNLRAWRINSGDKLLFLARNATVGAELWVTDGTSAGTAVFGDLLPGAGGSNPDELVRIGDTMVCNAFGAGIGYEMYVLPFAQLDDWVAQPFGVGCAGASAGAPELRTSGSATLGATLDLELSDATPSAPVLHYWSDRYRRTDLGACSVYLDTPMFGNAGTTDAVGASTFAIPVPNNPALVGTGLWLQSLVVEPGGAFLGLGGLSPALEIRIGN